MSDFARIKAHLFCTRLAAALLLAAMLFRAGAAKAETATTTGTLPDGTAYRFDVPDPWNGIVLIGLDYAAGDRTEPSPQNAPYILLLKQGYALGGTTRLKTGWAIQLAAANAVATLDLFEAKYGKPKYAIELGNSMGGHTAGVSAQAYPTRWNGAVANCGGLAGAVGQWQSKLDAMFVVKVLLAPDSNLPVIHIPKDFQSSAIPAWKAVFAEAEKTPAGRARIALAATFGQLPAWSAPPPDADKVPEPAAGDLEGRVAGLDGSLADSLMPQAMSSRSQIETLSGGNISSNVGVDYAALLSKLDPGGFIRKAYKQAGISLDDDLQKLARAPRFAADPAAIAYVATSVFDGDLKIPVLTMNSVGDPISAVASQQFYGQAAHEAGKDNMLRQTYVHRVGHCGFSAEEVVAVVTTMKTRLDTGKWPDTSAAAMNQLAHAPAGHPNKFIDFTPPAFQRKFTACDFTAMMKASGQQPVHLPDQQLPVCKRSSR